MKLVHIVCDFCSSNEPIVWFLSKSISGAVPNDRGGLAYIEQHDEKWAACKECSKFIVNGDQQALTSRSLEAISASRSIESVNSISNLHIAFFKGLVSSKPNAIEEKDKMIDVDADRVIETVVLDRSVVDFWLSHIKKSKDSGDKGIPYKLDDA